MSEQNDHNQNNDLKEEIKKEIKEEIKTELTQEFSCSLRKKSFLKILYPVITFIIGLFIGLSFSHFQHYKTNQAHARYQYHQQHENNHFHSGSHENKQQN